MSLPRGLWCAFISLSLAVGESLPRILIAGDSWGTDIAGGSVIDRSAFQRKLHSKGCQFKELNIAIPGSTAEQWDHGKLLSKLTSKAKEHDHLWLTLGGNDAQFSLPNCAKTGASAAECGDQIRETLIKRIGTIVDAVHHANPALRIVGFSYDVMFGGPGCPLAAKRILPQCWKSATDTQAISCFNTEFVKLHSVWQNLTSSRSWVSSPNLLGTTQAAANYTGTSVGNPDLSQFGPKQYWPTTLECIHPSLLPKKTSGAMVLMEQFHRLYWGNELGC